MSTRPRLPDSTVAIPDKNLDAAEAILAPLDALLTAAAKDDLMDRARPSECTAIRRSGKWLRDTVVKLLDAKRPTAITFGQPDPQSPKFGP